ncbi:endoplasmic reticulum Oxidoreductin 1-domain-containing protein [Syncephalastrum racemosum]|uniref:Endoplasmic reticulum Oxidoreductin 1-domain-containing protein n=1 Tax=Syncephalastrum racemosum TaxID=13706 RepID=A0A1X2HMX9_SYNRA|nr:endoplasmic reticulum Oxidoreductin 1-domain-containing protein [Syncephalastrum racemosum]
MTLRQLLRTLLLLGASAAVFADAGLKQPLQDPDPIEFVQDVLRQSPSQDYCNPTGQIKDTCCDYRSIEEIQSSIFDKVQALLDLWRECPFWEDDGLCISRDCAVETVEESILPEEWRVQSLSAVKISPEGQSFKPFEKCPLDEKDFCIIDDESDTEGVYVDLLENPERFTGYAGESSARVWNAIYDENCFNIGRYMTEGCETCEKHGEPLVEKKEEFSRVPQKENMLAHYLNDLQEIPDESEYDGSEMCLEKRVYYRLISGLHTSITLHICDEYFDQKTGKWGPNLDCFVHRVGSHPERLQNIYFTYALVVRAVNKLGPYLEQYPFCTSNDVEDDKDIKSLVLDLTAKTRECPTTFDEAVMFQDDNANSLRQEFRDHFRNVSRIMDCVGCTKCRLWGKIQTAGLGTALKVLFSYEDGNLKYEGNNQLLKRSEIVALFNTLNRLSESLHAIEQFRRLYHERIEGPVSDRL